MGYVDEGNALRSHFKTAWAAASETAPVKYDNDKGFAVPVEAPWVEFHVQNGDAGQIGFGDPGNDLVRYVGVVFVTIRVPMESGDGEARRLADVAAGILRSKTISNIKTRRPAAQEIAPETPWHRWQVTAPFWRDEHE